MRTTDLFHQRKVVTGAEEPQAAASSKVLKFSGSGAGLCAGRRVWEPCVHLWWCEDPFLHRLSAGAQGVTLTSTHQASLQDVCCLLFTQEQILSSFAFVSDLTRKLHCSYTTPNQEFSELKVPLSQRSAGQLPRHLPLAPRMGNSISLDPKLHQQHLANTSSYSLDASHHCRTLSAVATGTGYLHSVWHKQILFSRYWCNQSNRETKLIRASYQPNFESFWPHKCPGDVSRG